MKKFVLMGFILGMIGSVGAYDLNKQKLCCDCLFKVSYNAMLPGSDAEKKGYVQNGRVTDLKKLIRNIFEPACSGPCVDPTKEKYPNPDVWGDYMFYGSGYYLRFYDPVCVPIQRVCRDCLGAKTNPENISEKERVALGKKCSTQCPAEMFKSQSEFSDWYNAIYRN